MLLHPCAGAHFASTPGLTDRAPWRTLGGGPTCSHASNGFKSRYSPQREPRNYAEIRGLDAKFRSRANTNANIRGRIGYG